LAVLSSTLHNMCLLKCKVIAVLNLASSAVVSQMEKWCLMSSFAVSSSECILASVTECPL